MRTLIFLGQLVVLLLLIALSPILVPILIWFVRRDPHLLEGLGAL